LGERSREFEGVTEHRILAAAGEVRGRKAVEVRRVDGAREWVAQLRREVRPEVGAGPEVRRPHVRPRLEEGQLEAEKAVEEHQRRDLERYVRERPGVELVAEALGRERDGDSQPGPG